MLDWKIIKNNDAHRKWGAAGLSWDEQSDIAPVLTYVYDPFFQSLTVAVEKRHSPTAEAAFDFTAQLAGVSWYDVSPSDAPVIAAVIDAVFRQKEQENSPFMPLLFKAYHQFKVRGGDQNMEIQSEVFADYCGEILSTCRQLLGLNQEKITSVLDNMQTNAGPATPPVRQQGHQIVIDFAAAMQAKALKDVPQINREFAPIAAAIVREKEKMPALLVPKVYKPGCVP